MAKELAKSDKRVKLLQSIPMLGRLLSVLVAKEIDNVSQFRDDKELFAYASLVPFTPTKTYVVLSRRR